jgi:DNA adenine methylase
MNIRRPLVRYYGGKWLLADWIISHFPNHRVYVEPFGGGASVLLKKPRSYAEIYNDLDDEIMNLFWAVRERGDILKRELELTPFSRKEYQLSYEKTHHFIEQARRTIIKSFMGFGSDSIHRRSGFRADSKRPGTIPAHDWKSYPEALTLITERMNK